MSPRLLPEEWIGVATGGTVDRADVCAACGGGMYFRMDGQDRIVSSFCPALHAQCPAALREIPEP